MIRNALKSADFPQFSDRYDTGALRHSGTPSAHNGMLILVLSHSQFLHAVSRVGGGCAAILECKGMCLYCGTNGKAQKAMERAQARSNILL